jgi:hypothetical protein
MSSQEQIAFLRSKHCVFLRSAFNRMNQEVRDWNYWCDLEDWNIPKWIAHTLSDAATIESVVKNPEVSELTEKAITIFSAARLKHIDPTEFNAVIARLEEVLK